MTPETSPTNSPRRRLSVRAGLLAGACAIAVVGAGVSHYSDFPTTAANAQAAQAQAVQPQGGPPSFANAVERVKPAVVSVRVKVESASARDGDIAGGDEDGAQALPPNLPPQLREFFRQFGEPNGRGMPRGQARPRGQYGQAQGSGFFITPDGYVVTNNHVVANAVEVALTMDDGRTLDAKVIGTDPKTDLALLKVKQAGTYPFVKFARTQPRVGDWVIAVGNPFGLGGTVTAGIVSARGRDIGSGPYDDYLQIDAAVNRGNSGGPTFDMNGEVVGVNTAIYSPSGGNVGIAFAVPSEVAANVVESLKETGSVSRGFIGVQIQPVTAEIADSLGLKEARGALVADAQSNGPAAAAGVRAGDVIVAVDGDRIAGPKELSRRIASMKPGDRAEISVIRDGREQQLTLKLASLPNERQARAEAQDDAAPTAGGFGLGLAPARGPQGGHGVVVTRVDPDGAGARQGIKQGDVILEIGGRAVSDPAEVKEALSDARRDGKKAVLVRLKSGSDSRFVALAFSGKDARG